MMDQVAGPTDAHCSVLTRGRAKSRNKVPGTWLWAVSKMPLSTLDVVCDGRPDGGENRVDGKDRDDSQRHGDDDRQPKQRRRSQHAHSSTVLRVERPHVGHQQVAEEKVEDAAAPHCNLVEHRPVPCRQTTLQHMTDSLHGMHDVISP